jgi:hypothetical protein
MSVVKIALFSLEKGAICDHGHNFWICLAAGIPDFYWYARYSNPLFYIQVIVKFVYIRLLTTLTGLSPLSTLCMLAIAFFNIRTKASSVVPPT